MAKFRKRLKNVSKAKRLPKVQSAVSNTKNTKYRDLAKSGLLAPPTGTLTADALQKLENITQAQSIDITNQVSALSVEDDSNYEGDDGTSIASSYQTTGTFASQYSQCSNVSYNKFYSVFRADNKLHKEMWAILEAITEVIKETGGTESNTEYHCAMLTTLEKVLDEGEQDDQVRAILALIYMGLKKVPEGVLRKSFGSTAKMMVKILKKYPAVTGDSVIIKSSVGILCGLLKVQESAIWKLSSTGEMFTSVLTSFCLHPKPKLRKSSQDAVIALIRDNACIGANVPADKVAEFGHKVLSNCLQSSVSIAQEQTTILHIVGLMKRTIAYYSPSNIKATCEVLLQLLTLKYPIINLCSFQVLHTLFSHQTAVVPAQLNGQLISALYEYQPSITDPQLTSAWLAVLQQAHSHLADVELSKACDALPILLSKFVEQLWLSDNKEIISAVTQAIENVVRDVIQPASETPELVDQHKSKLTSCFNSITKGLDYQYSNIWPQVLHILGVLFEVTGKTCSGLLTDRDCRCLQSLGRLYDSFNFTYKKELEFTVGTAVRSMGPGVVLAAIPLKTTSNEFNLDRSWLLPVLRENVRGATLRFWCKDILPLAKFCKKQSKLKAEANENVGARSYELLYQQLWNLLPSFCNKPTDISASFTTIRKLLAEALADHDELRSGVMASLRKLIASGKESEIAGDLEELRKTCRNYIPILFNVYTEESSGSEQQGLRTSALETIKVFLSISDPALTTDLFGKALEQFEKVTTNFHKEGLLDIIRALVPYQNKDSIQKLYDGLIKRLITENNHTQQKKGYRLLEQVLKNDNEGCQAFSKQNGKDVKILLKQNLDSIAGPSKGSRITCFYHLVKAEPKFAPESKILKTMISEAVVCCKDINMKCRADSRALLNLIGEGFIQHDKADQFIAILLQGLSENTEVMSATILALTSILHNFTGGLGFQTIQFVLENVTQLMKVPNRDVVSCGLDFIKMYCMVLPTPVVGASLAKMMSIIVELSNDFKSHSRVKIKNILQKLVRKFGCESLLTYIPNTEITMTKILRNIRKVEARKKKQRDLERSQGSRSETEEEFTIEGKQKTIEEILADSDSEDEEEKPKGDKGDKKKNNTWIQEDIDTITDFTDPRVARRITSMNPKSIPTPKSKPDEVKDKNRGFKTDKEGRLIITDIADDDDDEDDDKHDDYIDDDDADSDGDVISIGKKRKRSEAGSTRSHFSTKSSVTSEPPMKYRPGGSGIHRPVGSEYKSKKGAGDMKKKGKLDPYAYIPLQRSALNKRKRGKMAGQFKGIVPKGVKKGKVTKKTTKGSNR